MTNISTLEPKVRPQLDTISQNADLALGEVNRREFMTTAGKLAVGGSLLAAGLKATTAQAAVAAKNAGPTATQPNIVFIITDQERYPQHWPVGWAEQNLPAHVQLAAHGLSFRRAYCNTAMCSPSRATLFTGLRVTQHGVKMTLTEGGTESPYEPTLPPGIQTMGRMLGSAGYKVVHKGKWHMSKGADGGLPSSEDVADFGHLEWEPTSVADDTQVQNFGGGCANLDAATVEQATKFLGTQNSTTTATQPFMLIVGLGNPHDVLSFPKTWKQIENRGTPEQCDNYLGFDFNQGIGLPISVDETLDTKPTCQKQVRDLAALQLGSLITEEEKTRYVNFYAGLIKQVDAQIGETLAAIPADIRDNTIVIFTSDHGEMGMAHGGLRQKSFVMYEEATNIPLIIHNPVLFPAPKVTDAYASLIDLMPTLATLAQVPNPEKWTFLGTDLSPLLTAPDTTVQNELLFTYDDIYAAAKNGAVVDPVTGEEIPNPPKNIRAIFTQDTDGEWKYAQVYVPSGNPNEEIDGVKVEDQYEMYQLRDGLRIPVDPFELDNLANPASPKYNDPIVAAKREDLAARLRKLAEEQLGPVGSAYLPFVQGAGD